MNSYRAVFYYMALAIINIPRSLYYKLTNKN